jgi:hypothetical protein
MANKFVESVERSHVEAMKFRVNPLFKVNAQDSVRKKGAKISEREKTTLWGHLFQDPRRSQHELPDFQCAQSRNNIFVQIELFESPSH